MGVVVLLQVSMTNASNIDCHLLGCDTIQSHMWVQLFQRNICRSADKSLAFPIFLFAAQQNEFFLDGLKKLEQ
jgi:hypothetical protein